MSIHALEKPGPNSMATWLPTSIYDITIDGVTHINLNAVAAAELLAERDRDEVVDIERPPFGVNEHMEVSVFIDYLGFWDQ